MAPGYVIAAICEVAGLLGVVVALLTMRAERHARARGLRSFLRSGQHAIVEPASAAQGRRRGRTPRVVSLPLGPSRPSDPAAAASDARSALRRAVMR